MNEIFHRVSIRKFQDKPVENEKIMQILRAGMQAPSAGNQQPWEFYVVTNQEKIRELSLSHQFSPSLCWVIRLRRESNRTVLMKTASILWIEKEEHMEKAYEMGRTLA